MNTSVLRKHRLTAIKTGTVKTVPYNSTDFVILINLRLSS